MAIAARSFFIGTSWVGGWGLANFGRKKPREPFDKRGEGTGMNRRQVALLLDGANDGEMVLTMGKPWPIPEKFSFCGPPERMTPGILRPLNKTLPHLGNLTLPFA